VGSFPRSAPTSDSWCNIARHCRGLNYTNNVGRSWGISLLSSDFLVFATPQICAPDIFRPHRGWTWDKPAVPKGKARQTGEVEAASPVEASTSAIVYVAIGRSAFDFAGGGHNVVDSAAGSKVITFFRSTEWDMSEEDSSSWGLVRGAEVFTR
jgi:hypothetical protein